MDVVLSDFVVGEITKYNVYVEIHDPQSTDGEPLHMLTVQVDKTKKNRIQYRILDDIKFSPQEKKEIVKKVMEQIVDGTLKLPPTIHFDSTTTDPILMK